MGLDILVQTGEWPSSAATTLTCRNVGIAIILGLNPRFCLSRFPPAAVTLLLDQDVREFVGVLCKRAPNLLLVQVNQVSSFWSQLMSGLIFFTSHLGRVWKLILLPVGMVWFKMFGAVSLLRF